MHSFEDRCEHSSDCFLEGFSYHILSCAGLYYDGNSGLWYTYDQETRQYAQYLDPVSDNTADLTKPVPDIAVDFTDDGNVHSKAVISAPASVSLDAMQKKPTLAEAVIAAAVAAQAASKKEKERVKEKDIRLAGKGPLLVSKKKISNAMNQWKQRQSESQAVQEPPKESSAVSALVPSDIQSNIIPSITSTNSGNASHQTSSSKFSWGYNVKDSWGSSLGRGASSYAGHYHTSVGIGKAKSGVGSNITVKNDPKASTTGLALANSAIGGLGRGSPKVSGRGSVESGGSLDTVLASEPMITTPFKTNASALGSYGPMAGIKRRFTETPQIGYRDRAAERRNFYGSSVLGDNSLEVDLKEKGMVAERTRIIGGLHSFRSQYTQNSSL